MHLILGLGAMLLTLFLCYMLSQYAATLGLVDVPGGRKHHLQATPLIGGLAIYVSLLITVGIADTIASVYTLPDGFKLWPLMVALSGTVLLGLIDDSKGVRAGVKFFLQAVMLLVLILPNKSLLTSLGDLLSFGQVDLHYLAWPFTLFALLSLINAINMIDGLDGLASLLCLVPLFAFAVLLPAGSAWQALVCILAGAIMGFLPRNFHPFSPRAADAFLGDAGSLLLGTFFAWTCLHFTQGEQPLIRPVTLLWFFMIPLYDLMTVVSLRLLTKRHPASPGRDHLHHHIMACGISDKRTVLLISSIAIAGAAFAVFGEWFGLSEFILFALFLGLYLSYVIVIYKVNKVSPKGETAVTH